MNSAMKIFWLIVIVLTFGCKKYPEGPILSLRTKHERLSGDWKIKTYTIGGVDSLSSFKYDQISIGKFEKKQFETNYINEYVKFVVAQVNAGKNKDLIGYCFFRDHKKELEFFGVHVSPANSFPDSSYIYNMFEYDIEIKNWLNTNYSTSVTYQILKLKESEFKLKSTSNALEEREIVFTKIK